MEDIKKLSDKELITLSKKKPERFFEHPDGRIIHAGIIYKNKKQFDDSLEFIARTAKRIQKIKNLFSFKKRK